MDSTRSNGLVLGMVCILHISNDISLIFCWDTASTCKCHDIAEPLGEGLALLQLTIGGPRMLSECSSMKP